MGFDINNFLNAESKKEVKSDWKPVKLSVHKLGLAAGKDNHEVCIDRWQNILREKESV